MLDNKSDKGRGRAERKDQELELKVWNFKQRTQGRSQSESGLNSLQFIANHLFSPDYVNSCVASLFLFP